MGLASGYQLSYALDGLNDPFASCTWNRTIKTVISIALHILVVTAVIAAYVAMPQIGLSFVATRILQGALIAPLISLGNDLGNSPHRREVLEQGKYLSTTIAIVLWLGIPAVYFGVPLVISTATVGLVRHLYGLMYTSYNICKKHFST